MQPGDPCVVGGTVERYTRWGDYLVDVAGRGSVFVPASAVHTVDDRCKCGRKDHAFPADHPRNAVEATEHPKGAGPECDLATMTASRDAWKAANERAVAFANECEGVVVGLRNRLAVERSVRERLEAELKTFQAKGVAVEDDGDVTEAEVKAAREAARLISLNSLPPAVVREMIAAARKARKAGQ